MAMIGLVAAHPVVGFRNMVTILESSLRKTKWKPIAATALLLLVLAGGFKVYATYYGEEGEGETITMELSSNVSSLTVDISGADIKSLTLKDVTLSISPPKPSRKTAEKSVRGPGIPGEVA